MCWRSRVVRGCATALLAGLSLCLSTLGHAQQGWVQFAVGGLHPGQFAVGAERIWAIQGGFDYEFLLWNVGTAPIDGFFIGVGNRAVAQGGPGVGNLRLATRAGGGDFPVPPGFPNVVAGGAFGGLITAEAGVTNPFFIPIANQFWGFEQFDDGVGAGPLPATAYVVRWYVGAGTVGPLPPGFFTRFDLISPFGPVAGGGGVDPLGPGSYIGIDDTSSGNITEVPSPPVGVCSDPGAFSPCTDVTADAFSGNELPAGFINASALAVPEPASVVLMALGLVLVIIGHLRRGATAQR